VPVFFVVVLGLVDRMKRRRAGAPDTGQPAEEG